MENLDYNFEGLNETHYRAVSNICNYLFTLKYDIYLYPVAYVMHCENIVSALNKSNLIRVGNMQAVNDIIDTFLQKTIS